MTHRLAIAVLTTVLVTPLPACDDRDELDATSASAGAQAAAEAASPAARLERARRADKLFVAWCAGCHGERGRGDGPAARVIDPKPRNLVVESFKIRTTASGKPPTAQDIFDTITRGLPGTAMPSFSFLPEDDRHLLVEHVRALAGHAELPAPEVVAVGKAPPAGFELLARGKTLYMDLGCNRCHGDTGRGDGPSSNELKDTQGRPLPARDYSKGRFMGGDAPEAIHTRLITGLDGSGMPSYGEAITRDDGWAIAHYVLSLREPTPPMLADPVARGRAVVADRQCFSCHVIEGRGGDVGPSLDVAARKLRYDWVEGFLRDPPAYGKIYPYMPYRMPNLRLSDEEIEGVLSLFAQLAGRSYPAPAPAPVSIDTELLGDGQLLFFLKCTECHNMGEVIPIPEAKRQGPDLIDVSKRIHFEWIPTWVNNPQQVYPGTRMVDTNLTEAEIKAVTAWVWKTSVDALARSSP